ncbi:MAG: hypothetical protein U0Q11_24380 [Vicinamibacterales bacterium]
MFSRIAMAAYCAVCIAACGSSAPTIGTVSTPTTPSSVATPPAPTPTSEPSSTGITGRWTGTGSDSFSPELVTLVVNQSGSAITGTAELNAVNPTDGSCGSCHKVKRGSFSGTVTGDAVTLTISFPAGGDVPTPICATEFNASGTLAGGRLTATYAGTDTCEGIYANGRIDLTQQ